MKVASLIVGLTLAQDGKLLKRLLNVGDGIIMLVKILVLWLMLDDVICLWQRRH